MVVMDKKYYIDKAHHLLSDLNTYRPLNKDPTKKLQNKLAQTARHIKTQDGFSNHKYKRLYPTNVVPPKVYGLPKIHKSGTPSGPLSQVRVPSTMGWQRSWPTSSDPLLANLPTTLKIPNNSRTTSLR